MSIRIFLATAVIGGLLAFPVSAFTQDNEPEGDDRVEFMLFEASMDLEGGRVAESIAGLIEILELDPDRLDAHLLYAHAMSQGLESGLFKNVEEAAAVALFHYRWVLDREPRNPEALAGKEWLEGFNLDSGPTLETAEGIESWARVQQAIGAGDNTTAIKNLRKTIAAEPENADIGQLHLALGKLLAEEGFDDEAIESLNAALDAGHDNDFLRVQLGKLWEKKDKVENALEQYDLALEFNGSNRTAVDRIVDLLNDKEREDLSAEELSLLGRAYLDGEQYEKATVVLEESLAAKPMFSARKALGIAEFFLTNDDRALELLGQAREEDAEDLEVLYYIGAAQLRGGDTENGRISLENLLQQDPNNPNALRLLGLSLTEEPNQEERALRSLRAAHRLGARIARYPCLLGTLYMRLGQRFNASAQFQNCIEEYPEFNGGYLGLGIIADDRGNTREAIDFLQEYINREKDPDQGAAFRLGVAYLRSGQDKKGFEALRSVVGVSLAASDSDSVALTDLELLEATSFFLAAARRFQDAIFIGENLLTRDPDNAVYNNNLAMSYADANHKPGRAHSLAVKANRLSPDNPGHLDTLGWALIRMNRLEDAEEVLTRSMRLAKDGSLTNLSEIHYHLGVLYHLLERHQESLEALSLAIQDPPTDYLRAEIQELLEIARGLVEKDDQRAEDDN